MAISAAELAQLRQEVGLGIEIASLINNETVKKALDGLLHGIQNEWLVTVNRDERELLWQKQLGVREFIGALKTIVDTGRMAQYQLNQLKSENDDEQSQ